MPNDNSVYAICQNKIFLSFNEWLETHGYDFTMLSEASMNQLITTYTHVIQTLLIDLMEQYRNAD